jgi:hypothetical protein
VVSALAVGAPADPPLGARAPPAPPPAAIPDDGRLEALEAEVASLRAELASLRSDLGALRSDLGA